LSAIEQVPYYFPPKTTKKASVLFLGQRLKVSAVPPKLTNNSPTHDTQNVSAYFTGCSPVGHY